MAGPPNPFLKRARDALAAAARRGRQTARDAVERATKGPKEFAGTTIEQLRQLFRQGGNIAAHITMGSKEAIDWFRQKIKNIGRVDINDLMSKNPDRLVHSRIMRQKYIGQMVMYFYDPKTKKKLPYYDRFPVGFIVDMADRGFYGINLHYLDPKTRMELFAALIEGQSRGVGEQRKLEISYGILKGAATRLKAYKPCFKRYLNNHVRSSFYIVPPSEWHLMLALPTQRFERGGKYGRKVGSYVSDSEVWKDSRRKIR